MAHKNSDTVAQAFDLRISRKTVQQGVVAKLREAILAGIFKPGNRLIEADLCASLGVSRPSLREALRSLEAERLIEIVPNRGPQIPVLSWQDAEEIYQVRALLEGEAAALCATAIRSNDLQILADALEAFRQADKDDNPSGRINATAQFYGTLLRCCGNRLIEQLLGSLLARINFLRARSMSLSGRSRNSFEEMSAIYRAIKRRDPQAARNAAQEHVQQARDAAKRSFSCAT